MAISILDGVLAEEYSRLERICAAMEKEMQELPKEYLSRKVIGSKEYYYLQKRAGGKVVSKYVAASEVEEWKMKISRRQKLKESIRECKNNMKKLEKVL